MGTSVKGADGNIDGCELGRAGNDGYRPGQKECVGPLVGALLGCCVGGPMRKFTLSENPKSPLPLNRISSLLLVLLAITNSYLPSPVTAFVSFFSSMVGLNTNSSINFTYL